MLNVDKTKNQGRAYSPDAANPSTMGSPEIREPLGSHLGIAADGGLMNDGTVAYDEAKNRNALNRVSIS